MSSDRFDQFQEEIQQALRAGLAEIVRVMDQRFGDMERSLRRHIDAVSEENRRHFGVLAESLQSKVELVIEGVTMVDQKVDRLGTEVRQEFQKFDRRLVRVAARIPRRRPRQ